MNDGLGNPKNNRSLLYTFKMSPLMSLGVRADMKTAVRAGVRHAMFTDQPDELAESLAPHLHDGSAATMREVLTTRNARDQHGRTSHLKPAEIDDLVEYVMSL